MKSDCIESVKKLYSFLDLKRKVVGIKFLETENDYKSIDLPENNYSLSYCNMVKIASDGKRLKVKKENFRCMSSARAFKFYEKEEKHSDGTEYYSYGLYRTKEIAKEVQSNVIYSKDKSFGMLIQPLEFYENLDFDVAIIITDAYNAMRIVQGYAYGRGFINNLGVCSNQAVCSELTVRPYSDKNLNISFLCSNSRFSCKWRNEEMGIGVSKDIFIDLVNGIEKTFNPTESDKNKKKAEKKLEDRNISFREIEYGRTYFYEKRKD